MTKTRWTVPAVMLSCLWGCTAKTPVTGDRQDASVNARTVDAMWVGRDQPQTFQVVPLDAARPIASSVVQKPMTFVRDLRRSEAGAATASKALKAWCNANATLPENVVQTYFGDGFRAAWFGPISATDDLMRTTKFRAEPTADYGTRDAFIKQWRGLTSHWASVERCAVKIWQFRLNEGGDDAWANVRFMLHGQDPSGARLSWFGEFEAMIDLSSVRVRAIKGVALSGVQRPRALFEDVSDQVGIRLNRSTMTQGVVQADIDGNRVETMGGLAVLDWNGDGRDDLAVWNRQRTFQVFVNDGQGGFNTILNPIPPKNVGLFQLVVDLDGDGRDEIVSSEVVGCEDETAWFQVFSRRGSGVVEVPERLTMAMECDRYELVRYQHIAAADIDGDGDLDLVFAGFDNANSMRQTRNQFQGNDGQKNLIFMNEGRLKFKTSSGQNRILGTRYSYASTFFDYDGDGDNDLYVVNDYGVNQLFANDGRGRFTEVQEPALTANGQSMGVTVADLDDDANFEVYVSNMYSYAGNRIVPLTDDRLSAGTFSSLAGLAKGNSAFKKMSDAGYEDIADDLRIARAGWAWGQSVFDADNDGRWDVYVVNGNASHSDARAPDY
ncbi:MAG: VCBS repeat-containing protein [Myxococcota bacterium]|nr:VCBS repeat-containing protein [Myxococcota bacterium]